MAGTAQVWPALCCIALCWLGSVAEEDAVCAAGAECGAKKGAYLWPMARGPVGSHSTSPYTGVRNLSTSLAWKWHPPEGKFKGTSNGGILIDDVGSLYAGFSSGIVKFTPDGSVVWRYQLNSHDIPAIMDGLLYGTTYASHIEAISMETGRLVWKTDPVCSWPTKILTHAHPSCNCSSLGTDIGAVAAHKGVVVVKTHQPIGGGACRIAGLNASNGALLWEYATTHLIWNFYPIVNDADDGDTFLFQDSAGGVYRLGLTDGREIWKVTSSSERWFQTWTDGGLQIGPNGVVYSVKSLEAYNQGPGVVRAYRVDDGKFLWESPPMHEPPNAWPVIGRMREGDPLTVIQPFGVAGGHNVFFQLGSYIPQRIWQSPLGYPLNVLFAYIIRFQDAIGDYSPVVFRHPEQKPEVWGFDADTGKLLWKFAIPPWRRGLFRSENERLLTERNLCQPNPCGNPTMDAAGNVYIGMLDGFIYHFTREENGPGVKTISTFDAEAAFSNGGTVIAPGMVAITSCDTIYVFKEQ